MDKDDLSWLLKTLENVILYKIKISYGFYEMYKVKL